MDHIAAAGIRDVTFITGDIHTFFAGQVTRTGRRGVDATDGPPVATEFVAGSITSSGLVETQDQAAGLEQLILTNNPHMVYTDQYHKGYAVLEARQDQLSVRYRAPRTIKEKTSEMFTLQDFRVQAGSATVERLGGGGGTGR